MSQEEVTVVIRDYLASDVPEIRRLFTENLQHLRCLKSVDKSVKRAVKEFDDMPKHFTCGGVNTFWVAEDPKTSRLVGIIGLKATSLEGVGELVRMSVEPAARRRGIARRLVGHVEAEAARLGLKWVMLQTLSLLEGALALYASLGYTRDQEQNIGELVLVEMSKSVQTN